MPSVKAIQRELKRRGFYKGEIDGIKGPLTRAAISQFKATIGYKATPYVGPLTTAALFESRPDKTFDSNSPKWLRMAASYLGLREIRGKRHNPKIIEWWKKIKAHFRDDETPWCAGFVGGVLEECGILSSRSAAARSFLNWGIEIDGPCVGCIVVFWRGSPGGWSGHVGFVVGRDLRGNLMVLGGNQGNEVNIKPFAQNRVLGYRWPKCEKLPLRIGKERLPVVNSDGKLSTNER